MKEISDKSRLIAYLQAAIPAEDRRRAEECLQDSPANGAERLQVARMCHAVRTNGLLYHVTGIMDAVKSDMPFSYSYGRDLNRLTVHRRGTKREQTGDINPSIHLKTAMPME
jgi:hypothetical protein